MRKLERFRPALIGSVYTGHIRQGSDIDLPVFTDEVSAVTRTLGHRATRRLRQSEHFEDLLRQGSTYRG